MEAEGALPDHLRCHRTDGRQWRCKRRVMDDKKLCQVHYIQGRHRQHKEQVPESLKLQRKQKNKRRDQDSELQNREIRARKREKVTDSEVQNLEIRARKGEKVAKKVSKPDETIGASEALDEAVKKMKLKRGDLQLELIREFLKREVEKKKKKERESESNDSDREMMMRQLPYGVMAISPPAQQQIGGNAGPCTAKLGVDSASFPRRCFRSKNIEPIPIGSVQIVPRNDTNLKKRKRKNCHWCRKSSYRILIKCRRCRKEFFCTDCITERFFDKQEVRMSCPVCRGTCSCRACSKNQSKDVKHKDLVKNRKTVGKIHLLHYLISMLLPVLEQINKDQRIELEIEAKIKGKEASEVQIQQTEFGNSILNCCSNCKSSIVDFHRKCTNCSYKLCLSCSLELCRGNAPGSIQESVSKNPKRRKACVTGDKLLLKAKQISISRRSCENTNLASPMLLLKWKACDDGSIYCPPVAFGGCGDGLLDLRGVLPFNWTKELEISAEEIVSRSDFPETSNVSSCCSPCRGLDHKAGGTKFLQGVAAREDSDDNLLYYPTVQDLCDERVQHFQKHWGKGHPVIVRDVIKGTSDLSWDPVVMFCTYLEKSTVKPQNEKESVKATNCLDWCEIEIGVKQIFMGSLEGRTHANVWREMLKFKGWLSSNIFQEQFPAHYSEVIRSLPLQEYMNQKSGLLNVAGKLPQEMSKPDLGPCIHISYGGPEELMQGDFLTKLCYESYDMVNILAHASDVPISPEQLTNIKKLMKTYKAQDHREPDKKETNEARGESPVHSGKTEESDLQDMIGEGLDLPNGVASVSIYSGDLHKGSILAAEDGEMSHAKEHGPEFDSEASILISRNNQSSDISEDQNSVQDDKEDSGYSREILESNSCGAQWDIFRRQDVPKLMEYLRRYSNDFSHTYCFPKHVVHPILDQSFFLDAAHKMKLKEEFNIEPWSFEQHLGEAVIIPAGCPYQIRKIKSCVNVVLDFISPENATECINLIEELRLLPVHHKARAKILEVKKMTLYGISAAIEEVCKSNGVREQ